MLLVHVSICPASHLSPGLSLSAGEDALWLCWGHVEINPLSVASFANTFSHSEGCLLVLFMVSFAVQKLFSFIRYHFI